MIPRKRKTYSDIDLSSASVITGEDYESENVSTGNPDGFRSEPTSPEIAFVTEFQGSRDKEGINYGVTVEGYSAGSISKLLVTALPRDKRARIKRAYMHVERDDLMSSLIEILSDFASVGFSLQSKPPTDTESDYTKSQAANVAFQQKLNDISMGIDAPKIASDLMTDWFVSDSMILYWRTKDGSDDVIEDGKKTVETSIPTDQIEENPYGIPGVIDIAVLKPSDVDWDNSIGSDILKILIPDALKKKVVSAFIQASSNGLTEDEVYNALMKSGIPKRWIDAIRAGRSEVQLRRENGDHWIIRTRARNYHGLANPRMYSVFLDLEMRNILKEGDASTALMMKHFILLIKQGESIETGPLAGNTRNWLKPGEAKQLLKKFSITNRAMLAVVNHTTKCEFIFPPKEMFEGGKYEGPEARIFNWAGVTRILATGDGGKYAGGFIGIKRTISKIEKAREQAYMLLRDFFRHETVSGAIETPEGYLVKSSFDSNVLKEPVQLLDELKFLAEMNWIDPRSTLRELERDPDAVKASALQSREENESLECWSSIQPEPEPMDAAVVSSGNGSGQPGGKEKQKLNKGGRPANPGTQRSAATRNQSPRASQSSGE